MSRKIRVFIEVDFDPVFGTVEDAIEEIEEALEVYRGDTFWDDAEYDIRGADVVEARP